MKINLSDIHNAKSCSKCSTVWIDDGNLVKDCPVCELKIKMKKMLETMTEMMEEE